MKKRYMGYALLLGLLCAVTVHARPKVYTLVELTDNAPVIAEGIVQEKTGHTASVSVERVLKGEMTESLLRLEEVPEAIPDHTGIAFQPGERVLLFLDEFGGYFALGQAKIDLRQSPRLAELVRAHLELSASRTTCARSRMLEHFDEFSELSAVERRFLLQVAERHASHLPPSKTDELLDRGIRDDAASVRWQSYVTAVRSGRATDRRLQYVAGLSDRDRTVRTVCLETLRDLAGDTFGYDPRIEPEHQAEAILAWKAWAEASP